MATTLRPGQVLVISHRGVPSNLVGWLHIKIDRGTVWVVIPNHRGLKLLGGTRPPPPAENYTTIWMVKNTTKAFKAMSCVVQLPKSKLASARAKNGWCGCHAEDQCVWINWSKVWTIRKCGMWHVHRQTFVNLEIDTKRGSVMTRWR